MQFNIKKGSFLLILLCLAVAAGSFFTGFKEDAGRKRPEESWEPVMENWQEMERFLLNTGIGKAETVLLYRIHGDGGIGRLQYKYDGENLYVLAANMTWGQWNADAHIHFLYKNKRMAVYGKRIFTVMLQLG